MKPAHWGGRGPPARGWADLRKQGLMVGADVAPKTEGCAAPVSAEVSNDSHALIDRQAPPALDTRLGCVYQCCNGTARLSLCVLAGPTRPPRAAWLYLVRISKHSLAF